MTQRRRRDDDRRAAGVGPDASGLLGGRGGPGGVPPPRYPGVVAREPDALAKNQCLSASEAAA